ncbi:MAG TPA: GNAT family N-acetyltransferase [Terriglobia bacterium]|nr:GNAT family N-acetyltransferase [Terriglobia bacterium]
MQYHDDDPVSLPPVMQEDRAACAEGTLSLQIFAMNPETDTTGCEHAARLRTAQPDEAAQLTELALAAKASWDYDAAFMARCREVMILSPDAIARHPHYLLERGNGDILGFYGFDLDDGLLTLEWLFVAPFAQGRGWGRHLFDHAAAVARAGRFSYFRIVSDPHAEPFYLRQGAVRCASAPSDLQPDRFLPVLRFDLAGRRITPL